MVNWADSAAEPCCSSHLWRAAEAGLCGHSTKRISSETATTASAVQRQHDAHQHPPEPGPDRMRHAGTAAHASRHGRPHAAASPTPGAGAEEI